MNPTQNIVGSSNLIQQSKNQKNKKIKSKTKNIRYFDLWGFGANEDWFGGS